MEAIVGTRFGKIIVGEHFWNLKLWHATKLVQARHVLDMTGIVRHNGAEFKEN